jgi:PAS domain-containing protein
MDTEELDLTDAQALRQKAEEQLKTKQRAAEPQASGDDVTRLLHELQVHQIELEMQNEELRQAYETTEAALKKFTMLYDLAPMGYFTLDRDGSIIELNFTGADMLGDKRFSLVNSNFKLYISEDSRPVFNDFFRKVYTGSAKESCEVTLGYNTKILCHVYMEGVIADDNQKCLLSVIDLSGMKKI